MKRHYFFIASIILLILSLLAFSDNLFTDVGQESNIDPKFIIHGIFFLAWFVILVTQSHLIRARDHRAHMKWGLWGMAIAIGVILSTFYVFYAVYEGWEAMPGHVRANRIFTASFAILVFMAYKKRRIPQLHKRYLYVGTLYVLGPIIGRVAEKLGDGSDMSFILFEIVIWNLAFFSLFAYDRITTRKIHRISWIGALWFYVVWTYSFMV